MKRRHTLLGLLVLAAVTNCSRIPENNDPILGIWVKSSVEPAAPESTSIQLKEEWIFNDVYLGRYQVYHNNRLHFYTDSSWELQNGTYLIDYYGTEMPKDSVHLDQNSDPEQLLMNSGEVFAQKE